MKVKDVMMCTPYSCQPQHNVAMAAELMWKGNCGFLPVLDSAGSISGVITDRDICIALCTRNILPSALTVAEVCQCKVCVSQLDDDIHTALQTMRDSHVRRLPVIDAAGKLVGVLSIDDLLTHAEPTSLGRHPELSADEAVRAYRRILQKDLPAVKRAAA